MKKLFAIFCLLLFPVVSFAANKFIRTGASGNGSGDDWTNAYASFAAAASAGYSRTNTYYIAGGTYTENPTITPSGSAEFTIKKAVEADHGTETGWDSAYGSDQAVINGKMNLGSYITFDGITGSGTSGYGIKVYNTNASFPAASIYMASGVTGSHIKHIDISGPGTIDNLAGGIYWSSSATPAKLHVDSCWIHACGFNGITTQNSIGTDFGSNYGLLIENNFISETGLVWLSDAGSHAQGLQIGYSGTTDYTIIRNNTFRNITSNAAISFMGLASHQNAYIYNNVLYFDDIPTYPGVAYLFWMSNVSMGTVDNILMANNTIFNWGTGTGTLENSLCTASGVPYTFCTGLGTGTYSIKAFLSFPTDGTNIVSRNNLWVSSYLSSSNIGIDTESNNGFYSNSGAGDPGDTETSDPFTNSASLDFTLVSGANAIDSGYDLSGIFTTDFAGNSRDANFDIGAYEYGGTPPPTTYNLSVGTSGWLIR